MRAGNVLENWDPIYGKIILLYSWHNIGLKYWSKVTFYTRFHHEANGYSLALQ